MADFGRSTITGKKQDSLRNSSGMPEAGTKARSSPRKSIELALGSVLGCLNGEIAVFIVAAIEMPLYLSGAQPIGPGDTLQQGHSMQGNARVKHPRFYCCD